MMMTLVLLERHFVASKGALQENSNTVLVVGRNTGC